MNIKYGSDNKEIHNILRFERIDHYDVQFVGEELKGKHFALIVKKLWDGRITEIDTIVNSIRMKGMIASQSDTLQFKVTAKKFAEDKLKVLFRFDKFGNERFYDATSSFDYSLRGIGAQMKIEVGKPFPAFAYILPYEKDGLKMWCAVDSSGRDVERWG